MLLCIEIIILAYLIYSWIVYRYIRYLNRKYLTAIDRTAIITHGSRLQSYADVIEKYRQKDIINILVLTGGGLRGVVPLQTLNYIEQQSHKRIGEIFDLVAGASTGAITAAALVVPNSHGNGYKNSVGDIAKMYLENSKKMFSSPLYHQLLTFYGLFGPRYLPEGKLEVLKSYFGDLKLSDISNNLIIPVYDIASNSLELIRNWTTTNTHEQFNNYLLCDLIHGASNPPIFFSPRKFVVNGQEKIFIDPAMIMNNPAMLALMSARFIVGNQKKIRLVLIGNGGNNSEHFNHNSMAAFGVYGLIQYVLNSPNLSSSFVEGIINNYVTDANNFDQNMEFININLNGNSKLHTTDPSIKNMNNLMKFGEEMFNANRIKIDKLINDLKS